MLSTIVIAFTLINIAVGKCFKICFIFKISLRWLLFLKCHIFALLAVRSLVYSPSVTIVQWFTQPIFSKS